MITYINSGMVFKLSSALQKDTEVLIQNLEEDETPKDVEIKSMKLRAKASEKVMLWNAL